MRLLLLIALAGCLPTTSTVVRTTERKLVLEPEAPGTIRLATERAGDVLIVTAIAQRRCRGTVVDQIETREQTTTALVGTRNGSRWGYALLVGMILAYPVGIGAAVVSGVAMLAKPARDQTAGHSRVVKTINRACNVRAANTELLVAWSSGASTTSVTDQAGQLVLVLAAGEPAPQITAPRVEVEIPIDDPAPAPAPAPVPVPARDPRPIVDELEPARDQAVTNMTRTARARARAGDCALVKQIGESVRLRDLDYYLRVFVPATAPCSR